MPFNELTRRESWPPAIVHLQQDDDADEAMADTIDENPFAFFLSSPTEIDDDIFDDTAADLTAGIETPGAEPSMREVSPSSVQREHSPSSSYSHHEVVDSEEDERYIRNITRALSMPLSLADFTSSALRDKVNPKRRFRSRARSPDGSAHRERLSASPRTPATPTIRGRVSLAPPAKIRGRGRGQTHSLPARRPHSWRLPSPDVWSIPEEKEDHEELDDVPALSLDEQSDNEQAFSYKGAGNIPPAKIVKKVRFASLP